MYHVVYRKGTRERYHWITSHKMWGRAAAEEWLKAVRAHGYVMAYVELVSDTVALGMPCSYDGTPSSLAS